MNGSPYRWFHLVRDLAIFLAPILLFEAGAWYGWRDSNWVRMDPRLGFDPSHRMIVERPGGRAEINPDMWGCGASTESWLIEAGGDTMRIVVLGGSSARGLLSTSDTGLVETSFARRLEEILPPRAGRPVEVINLGVPGFGSDRIRFMLRDAAIFRPSLVVLYVGDNEYIESRIRSSYIDDASLRAKLRWLVLSTWSGRVFLRVIRSDETSLERDRVLRMGEPPRGVRESPAREAEAAHAAFTGEENAVLPGARARFAEIAAAAGGIGARLIAIPSIPNVLEPPRRPGANARELWEEAGARRMGGDTATALALYREALDLDAWGLRANTRMRRAVLEAPFEVVLDPWDAFHDRILEGRRLFTDHNHLSDDGHQLLAAMIADSALPLLPKRP